MTRSFPVRRLIAWVERYLPAVPAGGGASPPRRDRRAAFAALVPVFVVVAVQIVGRRASWVDAWPVWRPMVLDLLVIVAGGALVAALAAGIVAWRRKAHRHA